MYRQRFWHIFMFFGFVHFILTLLLKWELKITIIINILLLSAFAVVTIHYMTNVKKCVENMLMIEGDPMGFILKLADFSKRISLERNRRILEMNIALGLIYNGETTRAIHMLENLSIRGFHPKTKGVFYNTLAFAYLMNGRVIDSQEVFRKHIGEMLVADRDPVVKSCARCTRAILDYMQDREDIALETLDRVLKQDELLPLQKAVALHYKGLILKKRGCREGMEMLEASLHFAGKTIFKKKSLVALKAQSS